MKVLFFRPGFTDRIMGKKSPVVNPIPQGRHPFAMAGEFQPIKKPRIQVAGRESFHQQHLTRAFDGAVQPPLVMRRQAGVFAG